MTLWSPHSSWCTPTPGWETEKRGKGMDVLKKTGQCVSFEYSQTWMDLMVECVCVSSSLHSRAQSPCRASERTVEPRSSVCWSPVGELFRTALKKSPRNSPCTPSSADRTSTHTHRSTHTDRHTHTHTHTHTPQVLTSAFNWSSYT